MTIYLLIAAVDFLIGLLALSKRGQKGVIALALISFSACIWSIELFLFTYVEDVNVLSPWFHLTRLGMFLIPPSLALLVWQLVASQSKIFKSVVVAPSFILAGILFALNNTFFPSSLKPSPAGFLPVPDAIYYGFIFIFLLCLVGSILCTALIFRSASTRDKQRIQWLLITLSTSFICGLASLVLISYDFYLSKFIGGSTNVIFMLLLFYSTVAHHLMDFKLAISLAVSRVLLLIFMACLYFAVLPTLDSIGGDLTQFGLFLILFIFMLEAYPRILKWLEPNARRLLASQTYDYDKVKNDVRNNLRSCNDMNQLSQLLNYVFYNVLQVREYHLCRVGAQGDMAISATSVSDSQKSFQLGGELLSLGGQSRSGVVMVDETQEDTRNKLASLSAACFFPVSWEGKLIAIVLIGRPTNSSFFRYDDIRLMEWMIGELAQTLQRISMLEKLHKEMAEAKKKLSLLNVMNLYHHDIKAPLSIIDGVVSNDLYDDEKRRQVILEQVAWGSQLITTMARLLNGGRKIKVERMSLEQVLTDCAMVFGRTIPNLRMHFEGVPEIDGDAEDLKILFINVLKNAHEATKPGAETDIQVRTWADSRRIYVAIEDAGIGMTEDQLGHLWDGLESTKKGGSGIGLQTIKRIADEHSASIHVESHPGKGTTFTFSFPLHA
jgi:signal transduction histidine kinase